jgi:GAF domain-containing protein
MLRNGRDVDLSSLARLFVHLSSMRDSGSIGDVVVRSLPRVLPVETSQLLLREESGRFVDVSVWRASADAPSRCRSRRWRAAQRVDYTAVFELLDTDVLRLPEIADTRIRAVVLLPLRASGQEVGLLVGTSRFANEFDRQQAEAAALLAAHTAASLDAALALGRERESALTDPLTGLLNRRGLEKRLERELDDAQAASS